jgi:hypothetical protein
MVIGKDLVWCFDTLSNFPDCEWEVLVKANVKSSARYIEDRDFGASMRSTFSISNGLGGCLTYRMGVAINCLFLFSYVDYMAVPALKVGMYKIRFGHAHFRGDRGKAQEEWIVKRMGAE